MLLSLSSTQWIS